jgi:hypothetical protein
VTVLSGRLAGDCHRTLEAFQFSESLWADFPAANRNCKPYAPSPLQEHFHFTSLHFISLGTHHFLQIGLYFDRRGRLIQASNVPKYRYIFSWNNYFHTKKMQYVISVNINPFRFYVQPSSTVWFSCSAPMSEDVRHGFCCFCSPAVGACPMFFLM